MYYDDGYKPKKSSVVKNKDLPPNVHRTYILHDGDIFTVNGLLLEFEDNILYEVEVIKDSIFNPIYERTGKSFTLQQINEMFDKYNK